MFLVETGMAHLHKWKRKFKLNKKKVVASFKIYASVVEFEFSFVAFCHVHPSY